MVKKNAVLFHGTGSNPDSFWFPYVQYALEKKGYEVWIPALPDTNKPDIKEWLSEALKGTYDQNTIIIGHSAGCPLILALLETLSIPVAMAIQVSGYIDIKAPKDEPILKESYNWKKIRLNANHHIIINSDNDPWGCNDIQGRKLFEKLGGTQIILHGEGHMGSDSFNQPYKEFPLLVKLIETYEHSH